MPKAQPHQPTRAVGLSVLALQAHRLKSSVRGQAFGRRVGVLLRHSSTKGTATPLIRRSRKAPRSVSCRSQSLAKPREQSE